MIARETSTRHVGWCPVCEGDFKVRSGVLVHHGYQRPGVGYIIGDCPGVGYEPYETGTGAAEHYLKGYVRPEVRQTEHTLSVLTSPEGPPWLLFENYDIAHRRAIRDPRTHQIETIKLTRAEADERAAQLPRYDTSYSWQKRLDISIANTESKLEYWKKEEARMGRLISSWAPHPLRTIEQEIEHQTMKRSEREAAKTAARNQKIADEVAKLQKRIDSAVKNKNSAVLADIFSDGSRKLVEVSKRGMSKADALALLDRDHVWRAFGLLTPEDGYLIETRAPERDRQSRAATRILEDMRYGRHVPRAGGGFDLQSLEWPAELGGGKAKTRWGY